jgi:hypothetical protein
MESAGDLYEAAKRVPLTSTIQGARAELNLVINEDFGGEGVRSGAALVLAYEGGYKPVYLKIPGTNEAAAREVSICSQLEPIPEDCNLVRGLRYIDLQVRWIHIFPNTSPVCPCLRYDCTGPQAHPCMCTSGPS